LRYPTIGSELDFSESNLQWVVTAYAPINEAQDGADTWPGKPPSNEARQ
jgi:hypothetical protein